MAVAVVHQEPSPAFEVIDNQIIIRCDFHIWPFCTILERRIVKARQITYHGKRQNCSFKRQINIISTGFPITITYKYLLYFPVI